MDACPVFFARGDGWISRLWSGEGFAFGVDAFKEAGVVVDVGQAWCGGEEVALAAEVLVDGGSDALDDTLLGGVASEGLEFALAEGSEIEVDGPGDGG